MHTRQLQQYTRPTNNNYTQDNLKLATIHTRKIRILQHVQKVKTEDPAALPSISVQYIGTLITLVHEPTHRKTSAPLWQWVPKDYVKLYGFKKRRYWHIIRSCSGTHAQELKKTTSRGSVTKPIHKYLFSQFTHAHRAFWFSGKKSNSLFRTHLFRIQLRVICIQDMRWCERKRVVPPFTLIFQHFRETMPEEPKTTWSKW